MLCLLHSVTQIRVEDTYLDLLQIMQTNITQPEESDCANANLHLALSRIEWWVWLQYCQTDGKENIVGFYYGVMEKSHPLYCAVLNGYAHILINSLPYVSHNLFWGYIADVSCSIYSRTNRWYDYVSVIAKHLSVR